ncbi:MAG: hypothetical protein PHE50_01945 [Dehalococcoidales bacterium]|nr:hypothetical protein [Dehalococcoidales bacterium]
MKVADLTVTQFRHLVIEIVDQELKKHLPAPEFQAKTRRKGAPSAMTLEQVCKEFGFILKE